MGLPTYDIVYKNPAALATARTGTGRERKGIVLLRLITEDASAMPLESAMRLLVEHTRIAFRLLEAPTPWMTMSDLSKVLMPPQLNHLQQKRPPYHYLFL